MLRVQGHSVTPLRPLCALGTTESVLSGAKVVIPLLLIIPISMSGSIQADELTINDIPSTLPSEIRKMIEGTFSPSAETRVQAVKMLEGERDRAAPAIPFLIRLLSDNGRVVHPGRIRTVGDEAELALLTIGKPALDPCILAFKQATGLSRRRLILVLGRLREPQAIDALLPLFRDTDPEIRRAVLWSLLGCSDPRLIAPLANALTDSDMEVRSTAVHILGAIRDPSVTIPLLVALEDSDWHVRLDAANSLRQKANRTAAPALRRVIDNLTEDVEVRGAAAAAFGATHEPGSVSLLSDLLKNPKEQPKLRFGAAVGLGESGSRDAIEVLLSRVKDGEESSFVRVVCIDALVRLDGAKATPVLVQLIKSDNEQAPVRLGAAVSIVSLAEGEIDDVAIVNALEPFYDPKASGTEVERRWERIGESLESIAKHGKSKAVRQAAASKLRERSPQ